MVMLKISAIRPINAGMKNPLSPANTEINAAVVPDFPGKWAVASAIVVGN